MYIARVYDDNVTVPGPQLCYECRKNRIRAVSRQRSEVYFSGLEPAEENLTTAAIVAKYLPDLTEPEIETKLARGEIARPSMIRRQAKHVEFSDEDSDSKPKVTNKKVTIVEHGKDQNRAKADQLRKNKTSDLYFTNIRDLNNKIVKGNVERNVGFSYVAKQVIKDNREQSATHKKMYPSFVSPRKVVMVKETNYKTFFDPPLIAKEKQSAEPAFFAGGTHEYKLPEKLPDELVFVDKNGKEVAASSGATFTDKNASVDGGTPVVKVPEVEPHASGRDLDCLKEDEEEEAGLTSENESEDKSQSSVKSSDIDTKSVNNGNKLYDSGEKPRTAISESDTGDDASEVSH